MQSIAILISVIFLGFGLRKWKLLKEEHGALFSKIIVNVTVPALIFSALSTKQFEAEKLLLALAAGILASFINIPKDNIIVSGFYQALHLIANANTFLVALTIGVMLHFRDLRKVWVIVMIVIGIKLIIQPLLSYSQAIIFDLSALSHQIVVLEASMPTAAMTAVFSKRYKCDPELTSILVFATFISSCITMVMMIVLLN